MMSGYNSRKGFMTSHTPTPRTDPEDIQRRNFCKGLVAAFSGFLGVFMTWPFIHFILPVTSEKTGKFIKVQNFPAIPVGVPTKMTFEETHEQAFIKDTEIYDIWVIKQSETEAIVYSPVCTHLSCRVAWLDEKFKCPCHGSVFDLKGECVAGPAPRPLDTLPHKIEGGQLYVQWKNYKAGIHEKVEA